MPHTLFGFRVIGRMCPNHVRHFNEGDVEGRSGVTRNLGGRTFVLPNSMVVWLVSKVGRGRRELTGAEEVLIVKRSPVDERLGTFNFIGHNRPGNIFA